MTTFNNVAEDYNYSPNGEFFVFGLITFILVIAIITLFTLNKYTKLLDGTFIADIFKRIDNGLKKSVLNDTIYKLRL